jgi:amino acid adenylation domain-containing protein
VQESHFDSLTIAEQERFLSRARALNLNRKISSPLTIHPVGRDQHLPLSFAQQQLWFLTQMQGGSKAYHMPYSMCLRGPLELTALRRALDRIVSRHETLRTTFVTVEGEPRQRIAPAEESRFHLLEHDLGGHHEGLCELERIQTEEAETDFDLEAGPPLRGRLVRMGEEENWLLITMHHIVSDGWSLGVFFRELGELYSAYVRGKDDGLPELEIQYADYAVWQRKWMEGEAHRQQAEYWKKNLAGAPVCLELPTHRARPARPDYAGAIVEWTLDENVTAGLKALSQRHGTTLYMTLLAAWAVLLGRLCGQEDVVIGTPVANRGRAEIENLIGFFVNMLALRVNLSGNPAVGEVLRRVKRQAIAAQQHQDIPFEQVVEMVQPVRSMAHSPIIQIVFAWQNASMAEPELAGLEITDLRTLQSGAKFDLSLSMEEVEGRIVGGVEYATSLYDRSTVEQYMGYLKTLLGGMISSEKATIDCLPSEQALWSLNRNDVKIGGYRIKPAEIEARLKRYPRMKKAVVVVREGESGEKRLVAYYTMDETPGAITAETIKEYLRQSFPEYMIPGMYVQLEKLPLTELGTLSYELLPIPEAPVPGEQLDEAPEGEMESIVAKTWAEVLKVGHVGRRDNFFTLGGRSLTAVQMSVRLRQRLGLEIGVDALFAHPTLSDFAWQVQSAQACNLPAITRIKSREEMPLSFAQQRLWFLAQMDKASKAYHVPWSAQLIGKLDGSALRRALNRIMERHEALRTSFVMVKGEPRQRIAGVDESRFHLLEHELRESGDVEAELKQLEREEAGAEFNLETGPLVRGRLVRVGEAEHWLLITMHHIVSDEWSLGIFFKELSELYRAYMRGEDDGLPELEIQYVDYAVWQRKWMEKEGQLQQAEYWRKNLAGVPELLELPGDRIRPARQDYTGALVKVELAETITAGLKELSQRHGATLYMTLLAAWAVLLRRLSGQLDVVIGTPVANRGRVEIENLIGFFVNMLAVRVDLSGRPAMSEVVERVKRQAIAAQQHQEVPFEQVVEMVQPVRSLAHTPLFQAMFAWQDAPQERVELAGLEVGDVEYLPHLASEFDLTLSLQEKEGRIEGGVEYATALFDEETIKRYVGYYGRLVGEMVKDAGQVADSVPLLEEEERRRIVYEWNETAGEIPGRCVHELFEEEVERRPDAAAVIRGKETVSYGELNRRANRLARRLKGWGVGRETRVGVCLERSVEMIVAMLGISKAGGAYVPLDAGYPGERLSQMMEDGEIGVVVTEKRLRDELPVEATGYVPMMCMDEEREGEEEEREENLGEEMGSGQLLYVMHTSGSTGRAKGVMVTHENVVRLVRNTNYVRLGEEVVLGHASNVMFDASTFEIWGALLNGGRLVVIRKEEVMSPERLGSELREKGVTTLFLTTAMYQECVRSGRGVFQGVKTVLFGGEQCDGECVGRSVEEAGAEEVVHVYGPTETTTYATYGVVRGVGKGKGVPIGGPIGNTEIYIVDEEMEAVGIGVVGEICVGGKGVTRGYGKNAEMTAEKYVPNGVREGGGERLYRTGDLGRWRKDGQIEFVGRRDHQVKIRGYRIELGEVETVLRAQPGVKDAVAVALVRSNGDKQLAGYVVTEAGATLTAREVRDGVKSKLPEYMVPVVVILEELPLTPTGKIDRKKLPQPEHTLEAKKKKYAGPRNRTEEILTEVWAEVLGLERVGIEENFFELGGDSIICVRIIGRAQERGVEFSVQELFEHQTVAALASANRQLQAGEGTATKPFELAGEDVRNRLSDDIVDAYPLSHLQAGMLFHSQTAPGSGVYHDVVSYRLHLPYQAESFQCALNALVQRHPMLRTSIDMASFSEPLQLVHRTVELPVLEHDWRSLSAPQQEKALVEFVEREAKARFIWDEVFRLNVCVHRLNESEFQCSFNFHHAIMDGWSEASLITELVQEYEKALSGTAPEENRLDANYRDYIALERRTLASAESLAFWKRMLEGHVATPVPLQHWREEESRNSTFEAPVQEIAISEDTQNRLQRTARDMGVPLKTVLLAAHVRALQVLSGQDDVTTGVVLNGRLETPGGERVLGLFLNTAPFRLREQSATVRDLIRKTFAMEQQILPHRRFPLLGLQEQLGHRELFQTTFNYVHFHIYRGLRRDNDNESKVITGRIGYARTNFDFSADFIVSPETGRLSAVVQCDTTAITSGALKRVAEYYAKVLAEIAEDRLSNALSEEDRRQIEAWNRTEMRVSTDCIHEIFEQQVEKTPDAVALEFGDLKLSYAKLNARANQIAHFLIDADVKPEMRVALFAERGPELIAGILGILKAGAVYVPLDPAHPGERLRLILEDSSPVALLAKTDLIHRFGEFPDGLAVYDLHDDFASQAEVNPGRKLSSAALAYIMYTSGSTGKPKGVMVQHHAVCNQIAALQAQWGTCPRDRHLQFASATFDVSVEEIFGSLFCGATLVLRTADWLYSGHEFWRLVERWTITMLHLPTRFWSEVIEDYPARIPSSVRLQIIGGEAVEQKALAYWFKPGGSRPPVWNSYGPTETTVNATIGVISPDPSQWGSIGRSLGNVRTYILDASGNPVPPGVNGELYIAGTGVARGYLNRPQLTAERFSADAFSSEPGGRMYRTGDLVRFMPSGDIEFLGRNDFQVKIRGYRIELGEIEACLREHSGVANGVVALDDTEGQKRLVAYYTEKRGEEKLRPEALQAWITGKMPDYMVPVAYVRLESLPLTENGKLDRKKLPSPDESALVTSAYEAPQGETEAFLARVWSDALRTERIGRNDHFFRRGGHSLLAMQVVHMLAKENINISPLDLFAHPTIESLAACIEQQGTRVAGDHAVCLRKGGKEAPLFLVHDGMGELLYASGLASWIHAGIPVYGLPALAEPEKSIADMATRMTRMIRSEQPEGPYRVAGWSFGGVLAYEIAAQLLNAGAGVEFVGLLDSAYSRGTGGASEPLPNAQSILLELAHQQAQKRAAIAPNEEVQVVFKAESRGHAMMLEELVQECRSRSLLPDGWEQLTTAQIEQQLSRIRSYHASLVVYTAKPVPVTIHLFMAGQPPYLGWDTVLPTSQIHAIPVQGTHFSMVTSPYIQILGQQLSGAMRNAGKDMARNGKQKA